MKTSIIRSILAIAVIAAALIPTATSCSRYGRSQGQSTEFATFIKAHTGGVISDKATIRVELASDIPDAVAGADLKDGILTFSPEVKGSSRWLSSRMIEFIPETGALKPGQAYTGKLRLDKIQKVSSRKFRKFTFKFLVAIKEAVLSLDGITITAASPEMASVNGTISLTEELPLETVQKMIAYDYPESSSEINVTAGEDPLHFRFEILNLARSDKDKTLKIKMKPEGTGFVTDSKLEITVPAMNDFKVLSAELVEADDPFIDIFFTEALADMDDNTGMFTLEGVGGSHLQIEDSNVRIYFENPEDSPIKLTVNQAVKSWNDEKLKADFTKIFTFKEEKPAVSIPVSGNILPNSKQLILPFRAVNLNTVDIRVIQIYEANVLSFLQDNDLDGDNSIRRCGRLVYKRSLRLDSDPSKDLHKWQNYSVDLSGLFKQEAGAIYRIRISFKQEYSVFGKKTGFKSGAPTDELVAVSSEDITEEDSDEWDKAYPYYYEDFYDWDKYDWEDRDNPLKASYYMEDFRFPAVNLLTSNLGVIAKYAGGDKIWVSVSDILSTDPIFNAELYVYSYQLKEIGYAKTGTDGMAEIPLSGKPFVVMAKKLGATSYLKVTDGTEKSLSRFDVGGEVLDKGLKAFIYGERGVWRPGDTLHVTMLLEDKEDKIPDSHPASMEVYTPEGQFYTKLINSNAKDGFYVFDIPTKSDDPTGTWNAYFKVGGASFHKSLAIEDIKPNRLKVNIDLGKDVIEGGKKTPVEISSAWLTGPAAAGLKAKVNMTLRLGATTFKGFEGYNFTSPLSEYTTSEHSLVETKLDQNGKAKVDVDMPSAEGAPGMLTADLVTSVEESGGDVSFSTMSVPYSPYSSYVGIKVPQEKNTQFLETDKDYSVKIAVVNAESKRVAGVNMTWAIYKLKWSWWWESHDDDLDSYVNGSSAEAISSGGLVSGTTDSSIPFRVDYPEWGRYLLIVKDTDSGHISGEVIYVDWPAYRGRSSKTDPDALTMLSFSTDKDSYDVGETVTVYIPSSSKGHALVSLENSRTVISREWVKTSGDEDTKYKFKVTPDMAPNFYIHVSLVQPHKRMTNDLPIRLYGVRPVIVNDKDSHLEPVITMPDVLRPEQEFTVKVKEKSGKPMTYTLAIVDEGLLDITSFKTPDPWKSMYEREALGVRTWDLYDDIIGAYSGRFSPMFSIGGDESIVKGAKKDNRFNAVVKFIGPFSLQSGTASHKIKLPMYVGSVRVMVVAAKDAAYGNAEKTVPVRSPLMVLPTLPRVISAGEKVTMPVNVFALENGVSKATVSVKASGPVKVLSDTQSASFSKPGDQVVRFNLETTGTGSAKITVTAAGGGHTASQTINIEVRNPNPAVTTTTRQLIAKGETKRLGFAPFKAGEGMGASLELAGYPALDADNMFAFVKNYPYTCTEQIASRGLVLIAEKNNLSSADSKEADKMIPELLGQMYQRQRPDGGFAVWPASSDSDSWISAMAAQFMTEASQNGFSVSKGVMASLSRYLKKGVQDYRNTDSKFLFDLEQAYRLYVLALIGEPESGAMNRLKESSKLSSQAAWMLASAYSITGKKNVAEEIIASLKSDFSAYQEKEQTYGSPARDKAIALESLALADKTEEALELAQEVSKIIADGGYTTQEAAFAAVAMNTLASKVGSGSLSATVTQNGKVEEVKGTKPVTSIAVNTEAGSIDIKNTGTSSIYALLSTTSTPAADEKVAAKSSGLKITVRYTSDNGGALNPAQIQQGTDFTVAITVSNTGAMKDCNDLALTQMIPSGWEIMNDRIGRSDSAAGLYTSRDIRDDRNVWHFDLAKGTSKTFKVRMHASYEGEFILPAIKCEAMYNPHISANTASGTAKVTR